MRARPVSCCFSGHRPGKLPWGNREDDAQCLRLKERIYDAVLTAYDEGYRHFICGMAQGCDMYFCEAVLRLREVYSDVSLEAAIPCPTQADSWSRNQRDRYQKLLAQCDYETMVQEAYTPDCMQRRNRYMVDHASLLIAVHDGVPGGTRRTIEYAMRRGLDIVDIPPILEWKEIGSMNYLGFDINIKCVPPLDRDFMPMVQFGRAFLRDAHKSVTVAVERADGQTAVRHTFIYGTPEMREADAYYIDRLVKNLLWTVGGFRIYTDDATVYGDLKKAYCESGSRAFDAEFMARVYEKPFEVILADEMPQEKSAAQSVGGHWNGCRIGFDAGGSDRKVSAVKDGETVFSEEVVWFPKENADPAYHYEGIVSALRRAAEHLPRVDAVGVSSAGVFVNDRTMVSSLFRKVSQEDYDSQVKDIYLRAVHDVFGDIPCRVVNDGDVSALCGGMSLQTKNILGIAMGTSEAAGYVDGNGCITGWLNELAFAPVDASDSAATDDWSGDRGCGVSYFSQDAVIRLAKNAGIELGENLSPAEKLKAVQMLMAQDDHRAARIYETIGVYLGHTLAYYHESYDCRTVLLLGRVMSGKGGELILKTAKTVLGTEYPELAGSIEPVLPDENFRRVGQSMAAASLPECD